MRRAVAASTFAVHSSRHTMRGRRSSTRARHSSCCCPATAAPQHFKQAVTLQLSYARHSVVGLICRPMHLRSLLLNISCQCLLSTFQLSYLRRRVLGLTCRLCTCAPLLESSCQSFALTLSSHLLKTQALASSTGYAPALHCSKVAANLLLSLFHLTY